MAIGLIAAGAFGTLASVASTNKASRTQADATKQQIQYLKEQDKQAQKRFSPFLKGGKAGFNQYLKELGLRDGGSGYVRSPFAKYKQQKVEQAVKASGAGDGNLFSSAVGSQMTGAMDAVYSQDYMRYVNELRGLGGMGMQAAGQSAAIGGQTTAGIVDAIGAGANATAAGQIQQGNAFNNLIGQGMMAYGYAQGAGNQPRNRWF